VAHGPGDRGRAVVDAERVQDAGEVHGDGAGADEERLGHLAIGAAGGQQAEDLPVTGG
jgi:hypothetical protein